MIYKPFSQGISLILSLLWVYLYLTVDLSWSYHNINIAWSQIYTSWIGLIFFFRTSFFDHFLIGILSFS